MSGSERSKRRRVLHFLMREEIRQLGKRTAHEVDEVAALWRAAGE
jgi:hypothetical protein